MRHTHTWVLLLASAGFSTWAALAGSGSTAHAQPAPQPAIPAPTSQDSQNGQNSQGSDNGAPAPAPDALAPAPDEPGASIPPAEAAPAEPPAKDMATQPVLQPVSAPGGNIDIDIDAPDPDLVEEDVLPTMAVYRQGDTELLIGGLLQAHFAPYVGGDSLVSNDDLATRAGFRLRRARLGLEARLGQGLGVRLSINPLEADSEVGTISDAEISYLVAPWLKLSLGTDKVPYTRGSLESSRALIGLERPLSVTTIVPDRRLGLTAEGTLASERLAYALAFMNATEGYELGNRFGGFLYALRLQIHAAGRPNVRQPSSTGVAVGLGGLYEDGPATSRIAGSIDVLVMVSRAIAKLEALCDRATPKDDPVVSPGVPAEIDRCGAYVELAYTLPTLPVQPMVRAEYFDDHRGLDDAGDLLLVDVGVNARWHRHSRVQLHYLKRIERQSSERSNDSAVLSVQGEF